MTLLNQRLYISRRIRRKYLTPSSTASAKMIEIISVPIIYLRFSHQNVLMLNFNWSSRKIIMRTRFKMTRQECKLCITNKCAWIVYCNKITLSKKTRPGRFLIHSYLYVLGALTPICVTAQQHITHIPHSLFVSFVSSRTNMLKLTFTFFGV